MKKISCIIPAYNEEKNIKNVLSVVVPLIGKALCEVIVVNDSSKDNTKGILGNFSKIRIIENSSNQGKSRSVANGIEASIGEYILMLDADLKFLNKKNIVDLIKPIRNNTSKMSIAFIKNSWPLFPFKKIDYLCGQRILPKNLLMENICEIKSLPNYGLEVFINKIVIEKSLDIEVVNWSNVEGELDKAKSGWWKGVKKIVKVWSNVISTISIFEMYWQNMRMIQLLSPVVQTSDYGTSWLSVMSDNLEYLLLKIFYLYKKYSFRKKRFANNQ